MGFTRAQARSLLPSWWDTSIERTPDGALELCGHVSRRLDLDFDELRRGFVVSRTEVPEAAFKRRAGTNTSDLTGSTHLAMSLARAVVAATRIQKSTLPDSASHFRAFVNDSFGVMGLDSLVKASWSFGIPVVPMSNMPIGLRKMDGAVFAIDGRPAIILSRKHDSKAWLTFIVAHELGHIANRHLSVNGSLVDVSLTADTTYSTESNPDEQEREADEYALDLLGGEHVRAIVASWSPNSAPIQLAVEARDHAAKLNIEPGHLILRFAHIFNRWASANTALNFLQEDGGAQESINTILRDHVDLDTISDDSRDFVEQVTGLRN